MTKEQERAEIAFRALSDLDNIIIQMPKSFLQEKAMRVISDAKLAVHKTFENEPRQY